MTSETSKEYLTVESIDEDSKQREHHLIGLDETTETLLSTDTDAVKPKTPIRKTSLENNKATPAIQRLHKTLNQINVHSPSDNIMSPCSQKLNSNLAYRKSHGSQPSAILKRRYQNEVKARTLDFGGKSDTEEGEDKEISESSEDQQENVSHNEGNSE
ncbi:unnamed protein product [Bursaphelenchus xylophilus]|uniref:(pine wood nematode) hypothetical protein n=1 Tax=Bursaphelenchus xylophilus TaxID=6326 RepID=A0A1I7S2H3_BURXY|nr:unnamed protein product [Bursaphelenchus xylophilus]CAG9114546.1 unnamed protein product [Bursaphelenchus xylophilus]